ncbi:Pept_C1 domain-containing protein [Meloidogyne graminicola]|uniref:eIF-4F 25 kDa subunit n=1 Tax=Meloidogyne graminicola TaxID=189291 RepID=A0A8S9ZQA9_9BILA|nr:Pept_C1 domain-containing protein [Meloidogyne graminicola]
MSAESNNNEKNANFEQKPQSLQLFVPSNPLHSDEHPLEHSYIFSYFMRPQGKFDPEDYAIFVQPVARISSVEQFWLIYRFIKRPSDLNEKVDFHLFKEGIKPVWEDPANRNGGKWILRLKKGLSSRIWENLLLAMIGEQFLVGGEVVGAVCSVRNQEDIISLWNRSSNSSPVTNRIRDTLRRVLNLPANAILEYKRHDDCLKDQRSYCHTTTIGGGQQSNHHHNIGGGGEEILEEEEEEQIQKKDKKRRRKEEQIKIFNYLPKIIII